MLPNCLATWTSSCGVSILAKLKLMPLRKSCCIFQNNTYFNVFTRFLIHHLHCLFSYNLYKFTCHVGSFSLAMAVGKREAFIPIKGTSIRTCNLCTILFISYTHHSRMEDFDPSGVVR